MVEETLAQESWGKKEIFWISNLNFMNLNFWNTALILTSACCSLSLQMRFLRLWRMLELASSPASLSAPTSLLLPPRASYSASTRVWRACLARWAVSSCRKKESLYLNEQCHSPIKKLRLIAPGITQGCHKVEAVVFKVTKPVWVLLQHCIAQLVFQHPDPILIRTTSALQWPCQHGDTRQHLSFTLYKHYKLGF